MGQVYASLEIITDDPGRFRHMLGRTNAAGFLLWAPNTVRLDKISRCYDRAVIVEVTYGYHEPWVPFDPITSVPIDFGPILGTGRMCGRRASDGGSA